MNVFDSFSLTDKVAVVTGASKGIGKAIALAFGQAGAKVVVSSRKQEAVDAVAGEFISQGIDAIGIAANMGNMDDVRNLVQATSEKFGGIDVIVNNAATNPVFGSLNQTEEWAFDKIMNVNVKGPFELAKLAHPIMKKRGGGSIINISSIGGISPEPMLGIYSVSKAALISLTKVQAKEMGKDNIRANAICPGLIKTKFSEALWKNDKLTQHMISQQPISRLGLSEDIAGLALFLASEASGFSTGGVYTADGGYTI